MEERPHSARNGRAGLDRGLAREFQHRLGDVRPPLRERGLGPIQYDESGYPLDPRGPSIGDRLRRLITG